MHVWRAYRTASHNKPVMKAEIQKGDLLKNFNQIFQALAVPSFLGSLSCDTSFSFSPGTWPSHPNLRLSFPLYQVKLHGELDWKTDPAAK